MTVSSGVRIGNRGILAGCCRPRLLVVVFGPTARGFASGAVWPAECREPIMKTTLETCGPLQVPVDETGTAVGRPEDTAPEPVWVFHLGLRFTAANGDRVASWQLVRTEPGARFPFPPGSYAHGVIDFRNGRIVRQALTDAVDQKTRERFYDHAQAMEGSL